jgi:folate-binding protein YgfZ
MITLSYLSAIQFSGADAGDFLHNQLSADVLGLEKGDSVFACYCEPKGRVLALFLVCRTDNDYCVIMSRSLSAAVTQRLKMYVMRSKVAIDILDESFVSGFDVNEKPELALKSPDTIPVPDSETWLVVSSRDIAPESSPSLQDEWKVAELKRGICWLSPESSGQFLPQMLGFDKLGAVNFRKGCYPGQEIVARTHYLGKVKRHPRLLCTPDKVSPDTLDEVQILGDGNAHKAIIADYAQTENDGTCLFMITRMTPDLVAEKIDYKSAVIPLSEE